jgi:hypothetical protein
MSTGISKSPDSRYWRELYRVALSESDKRKLPKLLQKPRRRLCYGRGSCFRQPAITAKRQRRWTA